MQLVKVHLLQSEPLQAPLRRCQHVIVREVSRRNLRSYKDPVTASHKSSAHNLLTVTCPVHLCRIDEFHLEVQAEPERFYPSIISGRVRSHLTSYTPGSEPNDRD